MHDHILDRLFMTTAASLVKKWMKRQKITIYHDNHQK